MNEHISIGKAIQILGISLSTMYRWESKKIIKASFRTIGNHRRFKLSDIMILSQQKQSLDDRKVICYARVSTHSQKKRLGNSKGIFN